MPNYTTVNVPVLRDALSATQAIRHARDSDEPTDAVLRGAHIAALRDLDHHPALYALSDEVVDRAEVGVMQRIGSSKIARSTTGTRSGMTSGAGAR